MKNPVQRDELRLRAIAAVVEGTINEFGEGGLGRLCFFQICKPFAQHLSEPAYFSEYELWIKIVSDVCIRRHIAFDARATCEKFTDIIWARELGIDLE